MPQELGDEVKRLLVDRRRTWATSNVDPKRLHDDPPAGWQSLYIWEPERVRATLEPVLVEAKARLEKLLRHPPARQAG